jgi:lysine 2,3-aminomutase
MDGTIKDTLISAADNLPPALAASVSTAERACIETLKTTGGLPFAVTPHFASLAGSETGDPIRRQFVPDPREFEPDLYALADPLGEARHRITPRLVRQYHDTALLLAGGACAGYCRFCFRRVRMSGSPRFISPGETAPVRAFLSAHGEIRELLVSGGDPLTAGDVQLEALLGALRPARPDLLFRICTRVPITAPGRVSSSTRALFAAFRPLRLVVHINHPAELSSESCGVLSACVEGGIPVHVQTVLLRGVNDSAETLARLFRECVGLGLTPYYLFQLDLAPGTAHFRTPLKEGLRLYDELAARCSGLALPVYAVDLPGGGGKIRLHHDSIAAEEQGPHGPHYLLRAPTNTLHPYPTCRRGEG